MNRQVKYLIATVATLGLIACVVIVLVQGSGYSTREKPSAIEAFLARGARRLAIPRNAYKAVNPVTPTHEVLADARAHFADHCALCHANDGSGDTTIGRNLYPKSPDMRAADTQSLSDGELFYIIANGIRLTGMPAWGDGDADDDHGSWALVHFIRHLPSITEEELEDMGKLNPVSPTHSDEPELDGKAVGNAPRAEPVHNHRH